MILISTDWSTILVAWWGAILATIIFLWDIYKHYSTGPRIKMDVKADRRALGDPELEGRTLILVEATNTGDKATTLKLMVIIFHQTWWQRLGRKPAKQFFIKNPGRHLSFPHRLEVGDTWNGFANQSDEVTQLARDGYLYCHLYCSSQKRPVKGRVVLEPVKSESDE
jgi:sulfur relay (sulfurtransferase) DsrC/TusE family protein